MIINFVANYQSGYVGEVSDETHIARELESLGHTVQRVPRDVWKAFIDGEDIQDDWVLPLKADINLIAKWGHFNDGKYIERLRNISEAPVFYWVWDYMDDGGFSDWHIQMAKAADLYLSGEMGIFDEYKRRGVKPYYFQMDVCDGRIGRYSTPADLKKYDVIFTGSCLGQGDRIEFLTKINQEIPITIFSWNWEQWKEKGFDAHPAKYGEEYNALIADSKIVLGLSVEAHCYGYWSNRVGKVITAKGFLLQQYAPGMEQFLPLAGVDYFGTPEEAIKKIKYLLQHQTYAFSLATSLDRDKFTSENKIKRLSVLMERYIIEDKGDKWLL